MPRNKKNKKTVLESAIEDRTMSFLKSWRGKLKFTLGYESEKLPYSIPGTYTPDFTIEFRDGRKLYIETKGYFDDQARAKMAAVRRDNPGLDIRLVFERDNPIRKRSKFRYSDWATKYGYPFAIGTVPESWLNE